MKFKSTHKNTPKALKHFWEKQFNHAKDPQTWLRKALELKRASDAIYTISKDALTRLEPFFSPLNENGSFKESGTSNAQLSNEELEAYDNLSIRNTYLLLEGFAFENILKGIVVSQHPEYIDIKKLNEEMKTHKLVSLSEIGGIKLDEKEKELLEKLTKIIVWSGRYPIPLRLTDMITDDFGTAADNIAEAYFPYRDVGESLFNKIKEKYT